ncbi:MAG: acyl carrier protein [Verrucomicrobiae bacterium]|nr:acyl carrier protein [Verrucomicrobiae bacterium]
MSESNPNNAEIYKQVTSVVSKVLRIAEDSIKPESNYISDLGADSLDRITLVMALEDAFKHQIPDEDLAQLTTVGSTVAYIEAKLAAKNQPGS